MSSTERQSVTGRIDSKSTETDTEESAKTAIRCDECGTDTTRVENSSGHQEWVCKTCGLVVESDNIRREPDWRAFDAKERAKRRRVGMGVDRSYRDKGLGTGFPSTLKDSNDHKPSTQPASSKVQITDRQEKEKTVTAVESQRQRLNRLQERWMKEVEQRGQNKTIRRGLAEVRRLASALNLSGAARKQAGTRLRQIDSFRGHNIDAVAAGAIYLGAYETGEPRTYEAVATWTDFEIETVREEYAFIATNVTVTALEPAADDIIPRFATRLADHADEETLGYETDVLLVRRSRELLADADESGALLNRGWRTLAATALYAAVRIEDIDITQRTVAQVVRVAPDTIQGKYRRLIDVSAYTLE